MSHTARSTSPSACNCISSSRSSSQIRCHSPSLISGSSPINPFNRRSIRLHTASPRPVLTAPVSPSSVSIRNIADFGTLPAGVPSPEPGSPARQRNVSPTQGSSIR